MVDPLALLARANLAAAAAILLVLAARRPARALFGARIAYGLWSLPALVTAAAFLPARILTIAAPPALSAVVPQGPASAVLLNSPATDMPLTTTIAPVGATVDLPSLLLILWAAGVIAAFVILVRTQRRFAAEAAGGTLGPAVVGVLAPRILRPRDFAQRFTPAERRLVITHERAHIARQDSRINGLAVLVQCLFWFNPLIHLGAHFLRIDQELACDEVVISRFPGARTLYAHALMKAQLAIRPLPLGCYWPSGTRHPLLERVNMIKRDDFSTSRRLAGAGMLAVLCGAAGLAAWAAEPPVVKLAQAPVSAQGAVSTALGAPAQPKVGVIKPTEAPATGGAAAPTAPAALATWDAQQIAEALDTGRAQDALDHGATAGDVLDDLNTFCRTSHTCARMDPASARYIRQGNHISVIYASETGQYLGRDGLRYNVVGMGAQLTPSGGLDSLPTLDDLVPPAPLSLGQVAVGQVLGAGGSAFDAAQAYIAGAASDPATRAYPTADPSTARWVQSDQGVGRVGLAMVVTPTPGRQSYPVVVDLPGTESYPGRAGLPHLTDAFGDLMRPPAPVAVPGSATTQGAAPGFGDLTRPPAPIAVSAAAQAAAPR